ncbi:MAG: hypothetical protein WBL79_03865 [Bacillota bacterium]
MKAPTGGATPTVSQWQERYCEAGPGGSWRQNPGPMKKDLIREVMDSWMSLLAGVSRAILPEHDIVSREGPNMK